MFIPDLGSGSCFLPIPDLGSRIQEAKRQRIPDQNPQHCLLVYHFMFSECDDEPYQNGYQDETPVSYEQKFRVKKFAIALQKF
jgi:hypothetical protein